MTYLEKEIFYVSLSVLFVSTKSYSAGLQCYMWYYNLFFVNKSLIYCK
jgi:hypothetical protein